MLRTLLASGDFQPSLFASSSAPAATNGQSYIHADGAISTDRIITAAIVVSGSPRRARRHVSAMEAAMAAAYPVAWANGPAPSLIRA
ncbi:MAG: hypothetical protein R3C51_09070 [Parvularculaceae bacterium]